jgi:hypothetical protein
MNPLVEAAAMALAHLYGQEDEWQKFIVPATAVIDKIEPLLTDYVERRRVPA